ncbi:DUF4238 domain-containing protein [Enterococcus gallinarum]|uniref:DUF4238 domain-containing protein n=1 Tax=Enterococcus gallinarum TaxID=1353 RepID=UPI0032E3DBEE
MKKLKTKNHFVPKIYLKQWATVNRIYEYKLLVSHEQVPKWNSVSITNTSTVDSLYLYVEEGELTDEMEDYFSNEFEMKFGSFVDNVNRKKLISELDHDYISKLVVGQYLRTLRGYQWAQNIVIKQYPKIIEELSQKMNHELANKGEISKRKIDKYDMLLPLKMDINPADGDKSLLKIESYAGKSTWIMGIKHVLNSTYKALNSASWTIYEAPLNFYWTTSDDPVIFLNYYGKDDYDFNGGFGNPGTEIIFPLSPQKLLYTKIGDKSEEEYLVATYKVAELFQKLIVEHAFTKVYSQDKNHRVTKIRKRTVDKDKYSGVEQSLKNFHQSYMENEVPYLELNLENYSISKDLT